MPTKRNASSLKVAPSAHGDDLAALCAVLASATAKATTDQVPPGWFTMREYAAARGIAMTQAKTYIRRGLDAGAIEKDIFRILCGKNAQKVPHYRVKK